MLREYCFTGWRDSDGVYHLLTMRREGEQLVVSEYAGLDPEQLDQRSFVRDIDPSLPQLREVAALLMGTNSRIQQASLDDISVVVNYERGVRYTFTDAEGNGATPEQLYQLILRHLDQVLVLH